MIKKTQIFCIKICFFFLRIEPNFYTKIMSLFNYTVLLPTNFALTAVGLVIAVGSRALQINSWVSLYLKLFRRLSAACLGFESRLKISIPQSQFNCALLVFLTPPIVI